MSWYRFQCVTKWQNQPYTNNANPQLFYPVEIAVKPDKSKDFNKLVKTFCPVNAGKYRNNGKAQN